MSSLPKKINVSIIIPCFNEEDNLPVLFDSINHLDYQKECYEVIVVDNGSQDKSRDIATEFGAKVISEPYATIAELRNIGSRYAKGDLFAFTDSDCLVCPRWLLEAENILQQEDVGVVGSIPSLRADPTWVEKAWLGIRPADGNVSFISSMNMVVKRAVFFDVGGFSADLTTGEDYEFCQRVLAHHYKIVHNKKVDVIHLGYPRTLADRFKKEIWYGEATLKILSTNFLYRPFWASLIYGLSFFLIALSLSLKNNYIGMGGLSFFLLIPFLASMSSILRSKQYHLFFPLSILYHVYLAGRFFSIIKAIFNRHYGKHILV